MPLPGWMTIGVVVAPAVRAIRPTNNIAPATTTARILLGFTTCPPGQGQKRYIHSIRDGHRSFGPIGSRFYVVLSILLSHPHRPMRLRLRCSATTVFGLDRTTSTRRA